jgi:hypothetical protein
MFEAVTHNYLFIKHLIQLKFVINLLIYFLHILTIIKALIYQLTLQHVRI